MAAQVKKMGNFQRFVRKNWRGYAFQAPFVVLFVIFVIAPVAIAFALSCTVCAGHLPRDPTDDISRSEFIGKGA